MSSSVSKNAGTDDLIQAIRQVHQGNKYFDDAIVGLVFEDLYTSQRNERQKKNACSAGS